MKAKSTKKVVAKSTSKKNGKAPKAPTIFKTKKFWRSGVRLDAQKALGSKGATAASVASKMHVPERKALGYLSWLAANNFCTRINA